MALDPQKKGKRGEVEFVKWLADNLYIDVERNYNQADGCSADVITEYFIFEVKRCQTEDLYGWWQQVIVSSREHKVKLMPIVSYRKNRQPWRFLVRASLIDGLDTGFIILDERNFIKLANHWLMLV